MRMILRSEYESWKKEMIDRNPEPLSIIDFEEWIDLKISIIKEGAKKLRDYLHRCGMVMGVGEDHLEDIADHVLELREERDDLKKRVEIIQEVFVRFKHLDSALLNPAFKTGELSIDIKYDLWTAIKSVALPKERTDE
jgi:2-iminoacetate synthase ThiH